MRMADKDSGIHGVRVVDERFRVGCVQVTDEIELWSLWCLGGGQE